jgi:NADPH-dependent glutamate synthase beta subunit-like oxidoreductase/ferredoxin
MNAPLPPTAWTTATTEVFKTGTWRTALPRHLARPSPCHQACPVNGEIATWIAHARAGELRRAWEVLTLNNPFPAIAGRVCHHPCESACNRSGYDEALAVCALERAVGDAALAAGWQFAAPAVERTGHVAVVGGGASGLSAAYQLRRRGWRVTLYEQQALLGGLMRYGIPAYRLAREVLDGEITRIVALGVAVQVQDLDAERLQQLRATHDAVYVATGAARSKRLPQLPDSAAWLMQGSDYLARCSSGDAPQLGRRILVIGGGSAAMDVARSARRAGSEVTVLALEPRERMPAQREELHEALEEGVLLCDGAMLRGVDAGKGTLSLDCVRVQFEAGRVQPLADSAFSLAADAIVVAIGQDARLDLLPGAAAGGGVLSVDAGQATDQAGIWAGGDVASKARFVTEAVGMGKRAAVDIDRALRGEARAQASAIPATSPEEIATWYHPKALRPPQRRLPVAERLADGAEVQLPLTLPELQAEAARCFSCGSCTSCDNCLQYCPDLAVTHGPEGYAVLADYCKGCGICVRECPSGAMLLQEELR